MLDAEKQQKHDKQIKLHRNRNTKTHQYPIRLEEDQYRHLKIMSGDGAMSDVVNRGIETEWVYHMTVKNLMKGLPDFKKVDDVQRWRLKQLKRSPELLAKYVTPAAILVYTQELEKSCETKQVLIDNQETIAYLIRQIGNNINQLARCANAGGNVSRDELSKYTKAVIRLSKAIDASNKEVT
ncbi:plasmid mobilization relaxosome protein MobC [Loigolactobacillus backii]|uniref:plasmid mobilization relaxosome protein MobC n=1 Tax=Loigolactobacillus backii TaxID=375175 RepID=UPI001EE7383A|nr:plasmid mobilization relaxosome protein MobC [Loigolactobacillus backii]